MKWIKWFLRILSNKRDEEVMFLYFGYTIKWKEMMKGEVLQFQSICCLYLEVIFGKLSYCLFYFPQYLEKLWWNFELLPKKINWSLSLSKLTFTLNESIKLLSSYFSIQTKHDRGILFEAWKRRGENRKNSQRVKKR